MKNKSVKNVLITGAASGLGRALALRLASDGADILIADIDLKGAQETLSLVEEKGGKGAVHKLDVTDQSSWEHVKIALESRWDRLDLVVNNAGVASADRIGDGDWETWDWIIDINLKGVVRGCRTFANLMKKQGSGQFLNVASLAGLINPPFMSSYNVSKAGVIALSETMHHELKPYGIGVTALCPGFFKTNLNTSLRSSDPLGHKMVNKLFASSPISADEIADAAILALSKNKLICNPHRDGKVAYFFKRFCPPLFSRMVNKAAVHFKFEEEKLLQARS